MDVMVGAGVAWIRLAAPGAGTADLRVVARGHTVIVIGRAKHPRAPDGAQFLRAEIVSGAFARRVELPWEPHPRPIELRAADGIVEITIGRLEAKDRDDA